MIEEKFELTELCDDGPEQIIQCPNCKQTHLVFFNPYYEDGTYTCSACDFTTAVWQFDIVWE